MTAISRGELMKELLPGLNRLFGMEYEGYEESYKVKMLMQEIEESDEQFIPRAAYERVLAFYDAELKKKEEAHERMIQTIARTARKDGVQRAANHVASMAEEMGNSNVLHAVALALNDLEVPE